VDRKSISLGTLLLIPLAFLVKDFIATQILLSREPGISERDAYYFAIASLPATLFVTTAYAMAVNLLIGGMASAIIYVVMKLNSRRLP
jgi:hypothetical protein